MTELPIHQPNPTAPETVLLQPNTSPIGRLLPAALHSFTVGYAGVGLGAISVLAPALVLLLQPAFVNDLLWSPNPGVRIDHFHQVITAAIVALVGSLVGLVGASIGKGPLSRTIEPPPP